MLPDQYGCIVANRFGNLLDDDDVDPFDLLNEAELDKDKKKKKRQEEDKKSRQKKPGQRESQRDRRVPVGLDQGPEPDKVGKLQSRAVPLTERGDGQGATKRPGERKNYSETTPLQFSASGQPQEDSDCHVRASIRGGKRGGGGRGGILRNQDSFNSRGKREYDRHNGTGISPEEKRGGGGAWNWGPIDEASCESMEVTEAAKVKSEEPQLPADDGNQSFPAEEEVVVHVAVEMSLDEWKALQEMSRPKVEFNIRKAENKIPSKAKVIHESKRLENMKNALEALGDEGTVLRRSVNDITSLMEINFGSLGRPSRGGRGRGIPRGGKRGDATAQPGRKIAVPEVGGILAPDPYNPDDFPALSAAS